MKANQKIKESMRFIDILTNRTTEYKIGDVIMTYKGDTYIVGIAGKQMWEGQKHYILRFNLDEITTDRCNHLECQEIGLLNSAEFLCKLIADHTKPLMKSKDDVLKILYSIHRESVEQKKSYNKTMDLIAKKLGQDVSDSFRNFLDSFIGEIASDTQDILPDFQSMTDDEFHDWLNE